MNKYTKFRKYYIQEIYERCELMESIKIGKVEAIGAIVIIMITHIIINLPQNLIQSTGSATALNVMLCDTHNIPLATNVATAELLVKGLERGDLDWRELYKN